MEILTLEAAILRKSTWAGKPVQRNLRHRPRRRSSVRLLVCVIAGTYHGSGLNMTEPEAQSLVPQVNKLVGRVETRYWKVIF